jgi:copper transport protein
MTALRIFGVACVVALAAPAAALAHANLIRSDPADRAVVAAPPRVVRLVFDDTIRAEPGTKAIRNAGASILAGKPRVVDKRTLLIPLRRGLRPGDYTVLWRALSDDGHSIAGIIAFGIGTATARPQPALSLPSQEQPVEVAERWLFLAGILIASGAALFTVALRRAAEPPPLLFLVGFLFVIAGGVPLVERTSLATRFGTVVAGAAVVAGIGAALAAAAGRYRRLTPAVWPAALLLLLAPTLSGHALDPGRPRFEIPVDILHVAAASVWLGGLLALLINMRRGIPREAMVRRFSALALGSVIVVAATGVIRAFAEFTAVSHVWTTSYGRLLIVKTALLASLVAIGWVNRYRVIPALARSKSRLRRNVLAEILVFTGLVTAVAFLTQTRPDRDRLGIIAPFATAKAPPSERGAVVIDQTRRGLVLDTTPARAVSTGAHSVLWQTYGSDEGVTASLVDRQLDTRRSTVLAEKTAPQFGLAVTAGMAVYATATLPPQLVGVDLRTGRRSLLTRWLIAPFASRGDRVAWAEQQGDRQRIVVHDFSTRKNWIAAKFPSCVGKRCYRIDAVTLANRGVAFDRGAIGSQPSLVVRRAFSAPAPETVRVVHDPQPDLIPSSAGATYFALGAGWRRWDFGWSAPRPTPFITNGPADPIVYDSGRWFVREHRGCDDVIVQLADGRQHVVGSPVRARALAGVGPGFCATFISLTWARGRAMTSWAVAPRADPHAEAEGVIVFSPPLG